MKKTWIILGIVVLIALWFWAAYNSFVTANQAVDNQWAQVEVQYQRRFDLIPNLVATVQGIAKQEQVIFTALAQARQNYAGAKTVNEKVAAANQVESALSRLLIIVENYPTLKSAENFLTLQAQLEGTENRIAVERSRYNEAVTALNLKVKRFPGNLIAGMFGFQERTYFTPTPGSENAPQVTF